MPALFCRVRFPEPLRLPRANFPPVTLWLNTRPPVAGTASVLHCKAAPLDRFRVPPDGGRPGKCRRAGQHRVPSTANEIADAADVPGVCLAAVEVIN